MRGLSLGIGLGVCNGGGSTSAPVGNLVLATSWADFLTKYAAANASGDVVSINHAGYTPTTPQTLTINRSMTDLVLIGASNQTVKIVANGQANCNTELVNWTISGDTVAGNTTGTGTGNYSVYITGSSKIALRGCNIGQGYFGVVTHNSTDIVVDKCNVFFSRNDIVRWQLGVSRIALTGNYLVDALTAGVFWYKTDGTTPQIAASNPGGFTQEDPDHNDALQGFQGACSDLTITGNLVQLYGQGFFLANDIGGSQTRALIDGNTIQVQYYTSLLCDTATDVQVSNNIFVRDPVPDPGNGAGVNIYIAKAGGTGAVRTGLNTVPGGSSVTSPYVLTGAMTGDTVVAPTASTFIQSSSTVGNLATLRARPSYTLYAGALVAQTAPKIVGPGGYGPYTAGDWLSLAPGVVKGRTVGSEATYQFRWKVGGSVVAGPTTGLSGAKWQSTAGSVTGEYSVDGGSTWLASAAVTVAAAGTTLDPANKAALITLSNGNLTATKDAGADSHALCRSIGKIPTTDGDYYYEVQCAPQSGGVGLAACSSGWPLTADPTDFSSGQKALGIFPGGPLYTDGLGSSNVSPLGSGGDTMNGTNWFGMFFRRTGGGTTVKLFLSLPSGWTTTGGDPYAAGAGYDMSTPFNGRDIYAADWAYKAGDASTFNFAGPWAYAARLGTVVKLA